MRSNPSHSSVKWQKIGKVGRAYGLRGAFFVGGRSDLLPAIYEQVAIGEDLATALVTVVSSYQIHQDRRVITVQAFEDRTVVERHVGQALWAPDTGEEEPYGFLLSRQVVDATGAVLGTISGFRNHGASDIAEITAENGATLDIPFVEAYFCWDFTREQEVPLRLTVAADVFAEFWSE